MKIKSIKVEKLIFLFSPVLIAFFLLFSSSLFLPARTDHSPEEEKISTRLRAKLAQKENDLFKVWIFFQDKGPDLEWKIIEARQQLKPETLIRRLHVLGWDNVADELDVPVWENYVKKINPYLTRLRHKSRWLNAVSAEVLGFNLKPIAASPFVSRIDEIKIYRFKEPPPEERPLPEEPVPKAGHFLEYGLSYPQLAQINVPALHDLGLTGQGIIIAMLDSGFNNLEHQALSHLRILATWDFVNNDPNVFDEPGQMGSGNHGTQTLGVMAGFYPGKLIGPAFGAAFLLAKTENTEWERHIEEDAWIAAVEWAEASGVRIISSSLGYRDQFTHGEPNYTWGNMDGETTIVTRGANIAARRGVLIVNSAGNEGLARPPLNTLVAPADSFWVLAVGAVDLNGLRTSFSSVGPTADGRIKPDVMAMGRSVYTASPAKKDDYTYVSGTSFSCPLVAGAAALILEANPAWSNQDIIQSLKLTATKGSNPDNLMGWGIINAFKAAFHPLKNIFPPTHLALKRTENNFGFFKEYIDRLTWRNNERNQSSIVAYRLYALNLKEKTAGFIFLAQVDAQTYQFERRGLLQAEEFLYKITAVNAKGEESDPEYVRR